MYHDINWTPIPNLWPFFYAFINGKPILKRDERWEWHEKRGWKKKTECFHMPRHLGSSFFITICGRSSCNVEAMINGEAYFENSPFLPASEPRPIKPHTGKTQVIFTTKRPEKKIGRPKSYNTRSGQQVYEATIRAKLKRNWFAGKDTAYMNSDGWIYRTKDTSFRFKQDEPYPYQFRTNAAIGWIVLSWLSKEDVALDCAYASRMVNMKHNVDKWYYVDEHLVEALLDHGKKRKLEWLDF